MTETTVRDPFSCNPAIFYAATIMGEKPTMMHTGMHRNHIEY